MQETITKKLWLEVKHEIISENNGTLVSKKEK